MLEYYTTNSVWPWETGGPVNSQSVNLACLYLSSLQTIERPTMVQGHALGMDNRFEDFKTEHQHHQWGLDKL